MVINLTETKTKKQTMQITMTWIIAKNLVISAFDQQQTGKNPHGDFTEVKHCSTVVDSAVQCHLQRVVSV